ncbi:MAG: hypothetical protein KA129_04295 [Microthrixaceae bacterium]|nr:hypothetical protein [Microthrixaceae bacterium]
MDPDGPHYEATALRCKACEARDVESKSFQEAGGSTAGLLFTVSQVEGS